MLFLLCQVPAPGSGVPGAPADWDPPEGMEQHSPVLFLDLNADDFSTGNNLWLFSQGSIHVWIFLDNVHQEKFLCLV